MLRRIEEYEGWTVSRFVPTLRGIIVHELIGTAPQVPYTLSLFLNGVGVGLMEVGEDGEVSILPFGEFCPEPATLVAGVDIRMSAPRVL